MIQASILMDVVLIDDVTGRRVDVKCPAMRTMIDAACGRAIDAAINAGLLAELGTVAEAAAEMVYHERCMEARRYAGADE